MEEDILLHVPHVKHKKDDGELYLMTERVLWMQPGNRGRNALTVSHKYIDIKNQKISSEVKPKIQLQIVLHDNTTSTFHFVNPEGAPAQFRDRDQAKELLIQLLPQFRRQINAELEEKNKLLGDNPALYQLYKDLVMDGIVASEDFWTNHANEYISSQKLTSSTSTSTQDVGVSSGFLSGIQPQTDGANRLRYNLTFDVIMSIFKTYPAVRRKHAECVPSQMSENQFWTEFCQSYYLHRDRLPLPNELFSDCAKADDKEMKKEVERVKLVGSNVVALFEDQEHSFSDNNQLATSTTDTKEKDRVTPQGIYRNIIKRFNQQSIMVLKACSKNSTENESSTSTISGVKRNGVLNGDSTVSDDAPAKKKKAVTVESFDDLIEDQSTGYQKLKLTRVDRYLNGPVPDYRTDAVAPEEIVQTVGAMRELCPRWGMKAQLLDPTTAVKVLEELRPGGVLMKAPATETFISQSLVPEVENDLRNLYMSVSELLRHFWSCFPLTSSALEEKLKRTHETLKKFEQLKVQQMKDRLLRDHLNSGPILAHITEMLAVADSKFSRWLQRSGSRR